jgi:hypothetical protein
MTSEVPSVQPVCQDTGSPKILSDQEYFSSEECHIPPLRCCRFAGRCSPYQGHLCQDCPTPRSHTIFTLEWRNGGTCFLPTRHSRYHSSESRSFFMGELLRTVCRATFRECLVYQCLAKQYPTRHRIASCPVLHSPRPPSCPKLFQTQQ